MALSPFIFPDSDEDVEAFDAKQQSQLETGVIRLGDASAPSKNAWCDSSLGVSYGDGARYRDHETTFMARVPKK